MNLKRIPLTDLKIDNSFNYRRRITSDSLRSLIKTLKTYGQQLPVVVSKDYHLVAGFRRCRALSEMGETHVWAVVTDIPLREAKVLNLLENVEREPLNLMEEAGAIRDLYRDPIAEFAEEIGQTEGWIKFRLNVTALPDKITRAIESGRLTESQVRQIVDTKTQNQQYKLLTKFTRETQTPAKHIRGVRTKRELEEVLVTAAKADWNDRELKLIRWLQGQYPTTKLLELIEVEDGD